MLSMWIKNGEKVDLYSQLKALIEATCGPNDAALIDTPLRSFQQTRNDILQFNSYKHDPVALERLIGETTVYVSVWNCLAKNVSFGPGVVQVSVTVERH